MCDYDDIDIHVRPPTLLILAARENRVSDIPYGPIHAHLVVCVLVYYNTHTRIHTNIIFIYTYVLKRDTRPEQAFSPEAMRIHIHSTHTHTHSRLYILL